MPTWGNSAPLKHNYSIQNKTSSPVLWPRVMVPMNMLQCNEHPSFLSQIVHIQSIQSRKKTFIKRTQHLLKMNILWLIMGSVGRGAKRLLIILFNVIKEMRTVRKWKECMIIIIVKCVENLHCHSLLNLTKGWDCKKTSIINWFVNSTQRK